MNDGAVVRVDGPLVQATHGAGVTMSGLVRMGPAGLPGEIVAIRDGLVTVQAYEYTGGLRPGDPVRTTGEPLSARLGPGLLGGVFDGLLRPLSGGPVWLRPDAAPAGGDGRRWTFVPAVRPGRRVSAGEELGHVPGPGAVAYRILVPPGVAATVDHVAPAGEYTGADVVATLSGAPVRLWSRRPVRVARPGRRIPADTPLHTGQRAVDLLYPVLKGSTVAVPGGFGTGKTLLLQQIAKWCDTDVIVYVGCGERGNEMADVVTELFALTDPRTGGLLADRTVAVANTSNMPMMAREASVHTAVTVAEYFRDMGYDVLVIADSTSRWAEALREFASRNGALPAEEGYPADLASALAAFYERAGVVRTTAGSGHGSVTIVGAVSPPGGDLTEPVTAHSQRFVRCLWTLDRELAYARHYPAVSWSQSFSRDVDAVAAWHARTGATGWATQRARILELLTEGDRLTALADLIGLTGLAGPERATVRAARLARDGVLRQSALSPHDAFCTAGKTAALVDAVLAVGDRMRALVAGGADPASVERADLGPLVRARDEIGPAGAAAVPAVTAAVLRTLDGLS